MKTFLQAVAFWLGIGLVGVLWDEIGDLSHPKYSEQELQETVQQMKAAKTTDKDLVEMYGLRQ